MANCLVLDIVGSAIIVSDLGGNLKAVILRENFLGPIKVLRLVFLQPVFAIIEQIGDFITAIGQNEEYCEQAQDCAQKGPIRVSVVGQ